MTFVRISSNATLKATDSIYSVSRVTLEPSPLSMLQTETPPHPPVPASPLPNPLLYIIYFCLFILQKLSCESAEEKEIFVNTDILCLHCGNCRMFRVAPQPERSAYAAFSLPDCRLRTRSIDESTSTTSVTMWPLERSLI